MLPLKFFFPWIIDCNNSWIRQGSHWAISVVYRDSRTLDSNSLWWTNLPIWLISFIDFSSILLIPGLMRPQCMMVFLAAFQFLIIWMAQDGHSQQGPVNHISMDSQSQTKSRTLFRNSTFIPQFRTYPEICNLYRNERLIVKFEVYSETNGSIPSQFVTQEWVCWAMRKLEECCSHHR
jgi:hypothetical protein